MVKCSYPLSEQRFSLDLCHFKGLFTLPFPFPFSIPLNNYIYSSSMIVLTKSIFIEYTQLQLVA